MRGRHRWPGLWPGLILVSVGGGLLAREFGLLPPHVRLVDFWPLLVVFVGVSSLVRRRGAWAALFSLAFIAMGGLLLAGNLGFLTFPAARLWPGLLVLLGLAFLLGGARRGKGPGPASDPPDGTLTRREGARGDCEQPQASSDDRLSQQVTFSGTQLRIESQQWQGGELGVTGGGVELDLRQARLAPEGARLDLRILMGGVDIRVPDTWQVVSEVTPLFGGADDMTRSTQGSSNAPRLRVTGTATLGGVTIRN